jgi:DNA mismatch repair protein MutS
MLGARSIYTTHLYELAAEAEDFNAATRGAGRVASHVARFERNGNDVRFTFKIEPGVPAGSSHAREVAARYGVSYTQLLEVLRQRGILTEGEAPDNGKTDLPE